VIYPLRKLDHLNELAEGKFMGVGPSEATKLWQHRQKLYPGRVVVLQPTRYINKIGFNLHKLLRCIDHNCLLSKLSEYEKVVEGEYFLTPEQLEAAFRDYPE
jgi:DNA polymerase III alpha subunit